MSALTTENSSWLELYFDLEDKFKVKISYIERLLVIYCILVFLTSCIMYVLSFFFFLNRVFVCFSVFCFDVFLVMSNFWDDMLGMNVFEHVRDKNVQRKKETVWPSQWIKRSSTRHSNYPIREFARPIDPSLRTIDWFIHVSNLYS